VSPLILFLDHHVDGLSGGIARWHGEELHASRTAEHDGACKVAARQFGRHQVPVPGMVPYFSSFVLLSFHLFQLELDLG
jgi:hypothetical protein